MTPSDMVLIKGGSFTRPAVKRFRSLVSARAAYRVTLNDFWLAKYQLTFEEYDAFCIATDKRLPGDGGWGRGQRPAIFVDWYDAVAYCNWRSVQEGLQAVYDITDAKIIFDRSSNGYRLPTHGEWEFAAKGGVLSEGYTYSGSDNLDEVAWYNDNADGQTQPVGQKKANELGLYDMTGNVGEWCWDNSNSFVNSPWDHPQDQDTGYLRVNHGGCGGELDENLCGVGMWTYLPDLRQDNVGFRLARTVG